jgi:hypothetical protein
MEAIKIAVAERRAQLEAIERAEREAIAKHKQAELARVLGMRKDVSIVALANVAEDKKAMEDRKSKEKEKAAKEQAEKEAAEVAAALESSQKTAGEALMEVARNLHPTVIAEAVMQGVAKAKEAYYKFRSDRAEQKLQSNENLQTTVGKVKHRLETAKGLLEGIENFHFTFGVFDESAWATKQRLAYERGEPFFMRKNSDTNMGTSENPIFLWYQRTDDEAK